MEEAATSAADALSFSSFRDDDMQRLATALLERVLPNSSSESSSRSCEMQHCDEWTCACTNCGGVDVQVVLSSSREAILRALTPAATSVFSPRASDDDSKRVKQAVEAFLAGAVDKVLAEHSVPAQFEARAEALLRAKWTAAGMASRMPACCVAEYVESRIAKTPISCLRIVDGCAACAACFTRRMLWNKELLLKVVAASPCRALKDALATLPHPGSGPGSSSTSPGFSRSSFPRPGLAMFADHALHHALQALWDKRVFRATSTLACVAFLGWMTLNAMVSRRV
jgi:hypothetical protein